MKPLPDRLFEGIFDFVWDTFGEVGVNIFTIIILILFIILMFGALALLASVLHLSPFPLHPEGG